MSGMWTSIRVEPAEGGTMPPLAALIALWNGNVSDYPVSVRQKFPGSEPPHEYETDLPGIYATADYGEADAYLQFDTSYQADGAWGAAAAIAARYPGAVVTLAEEWTGEEPTTEHATWRNGKRVTETVSQELPVDFQSTARTLADRLEQSEENLTQFPSVADTIEFLRSLA